MDTSETYSKMRLQATSDLGIGKPVKEPLFRFDRYISVDAKGDFYYDNFSICQLERQDQLQKMIPDHSFLNLVHWVWYEFAISDGDGSVFATPKYLRNIASMEQLWLAFVMKEKYNKVWNGEDWIEAKT